MVNELWSGTSIGEAPFLSAEIYWSFLAQPFIVYSAAIYLPAAKDKEL